MAEAFGIGRHELVSFDFRCGSPPDQRHRHPESPHLGVKLTKTRKSGHCGWKGCFRSAALRPAELRSFEEN